MVGAPKMVARGRGTSNLIISSEFGLVWIYDILVGRFVPKFLSKIRYFDYAIATAGAPSVVGAPKTVARGRGTYNLIILSEFGLVWIYDILVGRFVPKF